MTKLIFAFRALLDLAPPTKFNVAPLCFLSFKLLKPFYVLSHVSYILFRRRL